MKISEVLRQRLSHNFPSMVSHPPGWDDIVLRLHNQLMRIDPNYTVTQTKEKFGTLRFYFNLSDEEKFQEAHNVLRHAEEESARTCEKCGKPGELKIRPSGYRLTMCDRCYEELP